MDPGHLTQPNGGFFSRWRHKRSAQLVSGVIIGSGAEDMGWCSLNTTHEVSFVIAVYILVRDSALPIMHYYITVRHIIGILRTMGIPVFYLLSTHPL